MTAFGRSLPIVTGRSRPIAASHLRLQNQGRFKPVSFRNYKGRAKPMPLANINDLVDAFVF